MKNDDFEQLEQSLREARDHIKRLEHDETRIARSIAFVVYKLGHDAPENGDSMVSALRKVEVALWLSAMDIHGAAVDDWLTQLHANEKIHREVSDLEDAARKYRRAILLDHILILAIIIIGTLILINLW